MSYEQLAQSVDVLVAGNAELADQARLAITRSNDVLNSVAGPQGASNVGTSTGVLGDPVRSVSNKLNDVLSVKDKGATGLGVLDETSAFLKCPPGTFVPKGNYKVDAQKLILNNFYGPGTLLTTGGQIIRLDSEPQTVDYRQRRVFAPKFGMAPGSGQPNTEIYPGAQYSPQGLAYYRDPDTGEEWAFWNQTVSGTTWGPDEHIRTSRARFREDGAYQDVLDFTPPMRASHAHLSMLKETGKLWAYSSWVAPLGGTADGNQVGKGWSKFEYKGPANVDADLINYQVWGMPGSGHRYEHMGKACTQVSQCGKYMILIGINYSGNAGGRILFVYDRLKVEAMANPLDAEPIFMSRPLSGFPTDAETGYQGETSDGRFVYIIWGSGAVFSRRGVSVYTLTGEKLRDIFFEGPAAEYTNEQLLGGDPTLGFALSFEPEGITLRGDEIHVTFVDYWRQIPDIVSWDGKNYVNLGFNNVGKQPDIDHFNWRITTAAATKGEWDPLATYVLGLTTKRDKVVYCLTPPKGNPAEKPTCSKFVYGGSVAQYPGAVSEPMFGSHAFGTDWGISTHLPSTDTYRRSVEYTGNFEFNIRDTRTKSNGNLRTIIRTSAIIGGASNYSQFGGGLSGPSITMYHPESLATPGSMRINATGDEQRYMIAGTTKEVINATENVDYQQRRPASDGLNLGTTTRTYQLYVTAVNYKGGCKDLHGVGSPEGKEAAPVGSTYRNTSGGAGTTFWVKESGGTTATGWVAK